MGLSLFSFCTMKFKITNIQTLIYRAYRACSTYSSLHTEFDYLKKFFHNNGYPTSLIEKYIARFLNKIQSNPTDISIDNCIYFKLPYFGRLSEI